MAIHVRSNQAPVAAATEIVSVASASDGAAVVLVVVATALAVDVVDDISVVVADVVNVVVACATRAGTGMCCR